jgi:hypothetical protein
MIIVQCDGCYKELRQPDILTATVINVCQAGGRSGDFDKVIKVIHLCSKCKTSKRTLYFDNPLYVEPPEDAISEQKASQGS